MIDEELETAMDIVVNEQASGEDLEQLKEHIADLKARKVCLIEERAEQIAERMKDKWTNEGEKSTKYFLNLMNKNLSFFQTIN